MYVEVNLCLNLYFQLQQLCYLDQLLM